MEVIGVKIAQRWINICISPQSQLCAEQAVYQGLWCRQDRKVSFSKIFCRSGASKFLCVWLTGILQWGLGGTGKTVYWKQEGNYFNERRYDTAGNAPYRSNNHDGAKPGNESSTSLAQSPACCQVCHHVPLCGAMRAKLFHDSGFG